MGRTLGRDFTLSSGINIHAEFSQFYKLGKKGKTPILCLSGFGCSHYNFTFIEKEMGEDHPMILIDNRGIGNSSPVNDEYQLQALADDALEVMDQLGIESFILFGISMGGFVAQLLTLKAPERVEKLALLCTTSGGVTFIPLPEMTEEMLTAFYQIPEPKRTESAIAATVHPGLGKRDPELLKEIIELRRSHPVDTEQVLKQKRAVEGFLREPIAIHTISCPTLIMTGAEDRFVNPYNATILQANIRQAHLRSIPETDHLFFFEKSKVVSSELKALVEGQFDRPHLALSKSNNLKREEAGAQL